jgi:ribosomal-protein-alanine N-acetyltransferase
MTRPPLALEPASEQDIDALLELERASHSHPWSARNFGDELLDSARGRLVVLRTPSEPGDPGRGIVAYSAYRVVAEEMHILNLTVAPDRRRSGLGSVLLGQVLAQGARRGASRVFLEVRRSNRAAQALYERFGFFTLAVRPEYYTDPREDAFVLCREGATAPHHTAARNP